MYKYKVVDLQLTFVLNILNNYSIEKVAVSEITPCSLYNAPQAFTVETYCCTAQTIISDDEIF